MVVAQQIDNHFITPNVMQRVVKLHPAAVMLALLAGGTIAGFFGLLLAVPVAAVLKILCGHLWRTYVLGEPIAEIAALDAHRRTPAAGSSRRSARTKRTRAMNPHERPALRIRQSRTNPPNPRAPDPGVPRRGGGLLAALRVAAGGFSQVDAAPDPQEGGGDQPEPPS